MADLSGLAEGPGQAAPGIEEMVFLLRRHAGGAAAGLQLLPEGGTGRKTLQYAVREIGLPDLADHLVPRQGVAGAEEGRPARVEEKGQVPLREEVQRAPEGPALHKALRLPCPAPEAQGVEGLGVELALDAAEVPGGGEGVCRRCEMLAREAAGDEFPVSHGLPSLSHSGYHEGGGGARAENGA